nr:protein MANNAN SYNTHESIS-RELATED 1-like [Ipomoea batatas]
MAFDLRHILSGCLTAAMILMLCNMIKKDHIDPLLGDFSIQPIITPNNGTKSSSDNGRHLTSSDPWGVNNTRNKEVLNPCWRKSANSKPQESEGFVFVTLAQDPEYHISQIATAIVVAKYLGAALVIPNLRQSDQSGQKRMFGEIYDLEKFIESLDEKVMARAMDSEIAKIYNQRVTTVKDAIIPADEKSKFLDPERPELRQIVDFYVSSAADVYVPTSSSLFSDNVVARRIATGKRQVLLPANRSSLSAKDYVPPYISEKEHWAYSCFC